MVGIIKAILDIAGSDAVKAILESIREVAQKFQSDTPVNTLPQTERVRIINRLKLRLGQKLLNLSEVQFAQTMVNYGRASELQNA